LPPPSRPVCHATLCSGLWSAMSSSGTRQITGMGAAGGRTPPLALPPATASSAAVASAATASPVRVPLPPPVTTPRTANARDHTVDLAHSAASRDPAQPRSKGAAWRGPAPSAPWPGGGLATLSSSPSARSSSSRSSQAATRSSPPR
jgi:hypothetical protein